MPITKPRIVLFFFNQPPLKDNFHEDSYLLHKFPEISSGGNYRRLKVKWNSIKYVLLYFQSPREPACFYEPDLTISSADEPVGGDLEPISLEEAKAGKGKYVETIVRNKKQTLQISFIVSPVCNALKLVYCMHHSTFC